MQWESKSLWVCVWGVGEGGKEEDSMIENCIAPSHVIPVVQTQSQAHGKKNGPHFIMWEVALPQKVGPQEKKGVFLSFMPGSTYESGLALGSTLIAGGLQATWGPGAS